MENLYLAQVLSSPYQLLKMPLQSSPTLTKKSLPAKRGSVRTALRTSRSVSRYNSTQSPPEIAHEQLLDNQLSSQLTTSRRSASTSRIVILAPVRDDICRDVLINSPPASAVCTSISMDATSIPVSVSTAISSASAVEPINRLNCRLRSWTLLLYCQLRLRT